MRYFDRVADQWDELRACYFDERVREAAIARAGLSPKMVAADLGTGTGFMVQGVAPLVKGVYAFDASVEMVKVATGRLKGLDNVRLCQADGLSLPLPGGSVDTVFANMYLHHIPEPPLALQEAFRILRPGGRLVLTDLDQHQEAWMREEMDDYWLGFERPQVKEWLEEVGFEGVAVECAPASCCADSPEGDEVAIAIFIAYGVKPNRR